MTLPKLLYVSDNFYPIQGGSQFSMKTALDELSSDYQCLVICNSRDEKIKKIKCDKITVFFVRRPQEIINLIVKINPDIVLTFGVIAPFVIEVSKRLRKPVVLFIRDCYCFCPALVEMMSCDRVCKYCIIYHQNKNFIRDYKDKATQADAVIYNSNFMRKIGREFYGIDGPVAYPVIDLKDFITTGIRRQKKYISMSTPMAHKGIAIFMEIVKSMPNQHFLVAGELRQEKIKGPPELITPNLIDMGFISPREFYAKTKILLVPSIWPEPAPRVVLEAMANRIPVIASDVGGVREMMAEAGILIKDYQNPDSWVKKIKLLLKDKRLYRSIAEEGFKHSRQYNYKKQVDVIRDVIKRFVSVETI